MGEQQRREFQEALLDCRWQDLPGRWQAAVLAAEDNRPSFASSGAS
jgi:hypothetical protein